MSQKLLSTTNTIKTKTHFIIEYTSFHVVVIHKYNHDKQVKILTISINDYLTTTFKRIFCKIYKTMNLKKSKIEDRLRFEKEVKRIERVH